MCLSFRSFQCIPLQPPSARQKPCLYIWTQFEDHNFRLYQANWLNKMADRMVGVTIITSTICTILESSGAEALLFQEIGLDEVESLLRRPRSNAKERLVEVLLELVASCK